MIALFMKDYLDTLRHGVLLFQTIKHDMKTEQKIVQHFRNRLWSSMLALLWSGGIMLALLWSGGIPAVYVVM